ncbi:trm112p-like protein [Carex rostrata]
MVRCSRFLMRECADLSKAISEFLVCPLSKQPLRYCKERQALVSDAVGVSYRIVDGIPYLVPKDGKLLEDQEILKGETRSKPSDADK